MGDNKSPYVHLPIPTYEEATSSRPATSQARLGPEEISDDAERQGLLRRGQTGNYQPPTIESVRPSLDSLDGLEHNQDEEVRREMQQMDVEDPLSDAAANRSLLRHRLSKRFSSFTNSFSSLSLPSFRQYLPTFSWPRIDYQQLDSNRVVIIGRLFGIFLIMGVLYVLIASDVLSFTKNRMGMGQMYDPESIRVFVQNHMNDHGHMQKYLEHITDFPHIAGTEGNYVLGEWVAELFKGSELEDVHMERFDVYLNYPRKDGRRVAIVEPDNLKWEATIEEDQEQAYVFHGHSKSGDVTGPLVYANFGSREDFKTLADNGISVKDAIVLVRYYGSEGDRALKVKAAEQAGAAGCIIYSDPSQDGFVQGPTFPDGRFMPDDGVQRGAVSLMSWVVGDVLTPGWASTPAEKERLKPEDSTGLNKIPSIPISWNAAKHLLEAIKGHGKQMTDIWTGAPNTEYWTGGPDSPKVNLKNVQDEEIKQPIYNVLGKITGWEEPKKRVVVGNHRDAWCTGAADPGSGTAVMLEVIRILGELRRLGWRPLRTIEFASWDGEEYNLIGSTEHVENRLAELRKDGVAYLNVDVGVTGIDFHAAASPLFERSLAHVLDRVGDPFSGRSIHEIWESSNQGLEGLGAGSDFVAFQDIVGTSSIDMFFKGQRYPYHSCYDNFEWMSKFGDPDFKYHKAMGEILALLILEMADKPLLPFDLNAYATAVTKYVDDLATYVKSASTATGQNTLDLTPLREAAESFTREAQQFHEFDDIWRNFVFGAGGFESSAMTTARSKHNERIAHFETDLLDLSEGGGLANRTQFKHVIFAPQAWSGYDEAYFPSIRDAIDAGDWAEAQHQTQKVADIIAAAVKKLNA
ncbi:glutamate carboxypeptidase [Exophiala dermatitidis]